MPRFKPVAKSPFWTVCLVAGYLVIGEAMRSSMTHGWNDSLWYSWILPACAILTALLLLRVLIDHDDAP